jgi:hypothetical protein
MLVQVMIRGSTLALMAAAACAAQSGSMPIPPTFFAVSSVSANDFPKVSIGTLGHPVFSWAAAETARGVYNFSGLDQNVNAAKQHGLADATNTVNMTLTLDGTPQWAAASASSCSSKSGAAPTCTSPPANMQDWSDFITAVIKRYNGVTQPHIRYYELWNEVTATNFWTGTDADLLNMAKAAYPIVHTDPYSMLLTPSVSGAVGNVPQSGSTWMAGYLKEGGANYVDGLAFHGYIGATGVTPFPWPEQDTTAGCTAKASECFGSIVTKANIFRQIMDTNGMKGKPLLQTEGGWGDGNITNSDDQIAWLSRWLLLQAGLYSADNLQIAAWWTWGGGAGQTWGDIETAESTPTPAGLAYSQVYDWLAGATIAQPCSPSSDSTWTCTLTRPGGYLGQAVWNTAAPKPYTPGASYTQYRDLAGSTVKIPAGGNITIGSKPVLVEGTGKPPAGQGRSGRCPPRCTGHK